MAVVFVVTSLSYTYVTSSRPSDESAVLKVEPLTIEDVPAKPAPRLKLLLRPSLPRPAKLPRLLRLLPPLPMLLRPLRLPKLPPLRLLLRTLPQPSLPSSRRFFDPMGKSRGPAAAFFSNRGLP